MDTAYFTQIVGVNSNVCFSIIIPSMAIYSIIRFDWPIFIVNVSGMWN